jgi:hypothetical protein
MSSYSIDQPRIESMGFLSLSVWLTFFSYSFAYSHPFFIRPFAPLFEQSKRVSDDDDE